MQLKTILNCVHRQPGFVYGRVEWFTEGEHLALRVEIRPHGRSRGRCSKRLKKRTGAGVAEVLIVQEPDGALASPEMA